MCPRPNVPFSRGLAFAKIPDFQIMKRRRSRQKLLRRKLRKGRRKLRKKLQRRKKMRRRAEKRKQIGLQGVKQRKIDNSYFVASFSHFLTKNHFYILVN